MKSLKNEPNLRNDARHTKLNCEVGNEALNLRNPMANTSSQIDVLAVDDDPEFAGYVAGVAKEIGLKAEAVTDPAQFAARCEKLHPLIVVLDIEMPSISGLQLAQWLGEHSRSTGIEVRLIVLSGRGEEMIRLCQSVGAISGLRDIIALAKPVEFSVLAQALKGKSSR